MRPLLLTALLLFSHVSAWANDLGVSISIGQPGFYGQITLGDHFPVPRVIYSTPRVAIQPAATMQQQPVYLHIPPGHAKKWHKHCHRYNACHIPVYFVQEDWYNTVYVPQYARQHQQQPHDPYDRTDDAHRRSEGQNHKHNRHKSSHRNDGERFDDDRQERAPGRSRDHDGHGKQGKQDKKDHERGNRHD
ncbi:MAG: hypothetical protein LZF61_08650 [Nitrosomonas sp.]|nr:MAG: hypothetical protein LZF61_08650 [Nitrosomonas sp.]